MKLVVGLGNPGRKYRGTRHNVGYYVLAELARRHAQEQRPKSKFQAEIVEVDLVGHRTLLLSPITYMNRSGESVQAASHFYKLSCDDLLVICDDMNLPLEKIRFRARGSAGGQKGLADVIRRLATEEFARLRIGIDSPPEGWDAADYVLGKFSQEESSRIESAVGRAADGVVVWAREGIEACMNQYN